MLTISLSKNLTLEMLLSLQFLFTIPESSMSPTNREQHLNSEMITDSWLLLKYSTNKSSHINDLLNLDALANSQNNYANTSHK